MKKQTKKSTAMFVIAYIGMIVGVILALFFGFGMGVMVFGDNLFGRIVGVGLAFLMIVGIGALAQGAGILGK